MRSLTILLLLVISIPCALASNRIDSLSQILGVQEKEGDVSASINTLQELGKAYQKKSDFPRAFEYYQEALQLSLRYGPKEQIVAIKIELGITLSWMDKFDESLRYHLEALKENKWLTPKEEAKLLVHIAQTYRFKGDYTKAAEHQYRGLSISESIQDSMGIVLGHFILSTIYYYSHQDDKSKIESYKAYEAYQKFYPGETTEYLHVILHSLAAVESREENMEKYEYFTRESMRVALELDDGYTIASSHGAMGNMFIKKEAYDSAASYFLNAIQYFEEAGIQQDQVMYQEHLGATYRKMNKLPESMKVLNEALLGALNINSPDLEKRVYEELYQNYEVLGNYEKANVFMKKYTVLKDSLEGEANQKELSNLREQYEIQKREKEIEILRTESRERLNRLYLTALAIGLGLSSIILMLLYNRYKAKASRNEILLKKNKEIAHKNKQLSSLNEDLLKFSEIVSKDLQGALQKVRVICQRIEEESSTTSHEVAQIETHLKEMEDVLYGLLVYSMTGSKEDSFELCDSKEVIAQTLSELPNHVKNKSLKVSLHNLPKVLANRKKFAQLFSYLVSYSLKHQEDTFSMIKISSGENEGEFEFIINNEGTGIPDEQANDIFKVLSHEESSKYTDIELAVSRKIVEQHQGKIWVESRKDEGISFHFTIPKHEELVV